MKTLTHLNTCVKAFFYGIRYPTFLKESINSLYRKGFTQRRLDQTNIPEKQLIEISDVNQPIKLQNFWVREGNVTSFEMMVIASLIAHLKPKNLLEIGTFDGNTTLQMALNAPKDAAIHTIDLPDGGWNTQIPIIENDLPFVKDQKKSARKFAGSSVAKKVIQHFGDSTNYDFGKFTLAGPIDFCFIDGGHSYECVKSDTEHVLPHMSPKGVILWHDFDPKWPGVFKHLSELSQTQPLVHITDTRLVARLPT